ncbi:uncharacterized protein LOC131497889 isoform X2 [Neofelis nebulosa]|uniref:uncharacterized protein LOC131497889 isoform X2 n=1 Tax=Neofelis nebulosa TaxID=61452 RepID=UPI00272C7D15|nr:uncharacterized protein LOC131497889 isoform X2 [Neofelis nebulosa]
MRICTRACVWLCVRVGTCAQVFLSMCVHLCVQVCRWRYVHVGLGGDVHRCGRIRVDVCVDVCGCVRVHTHTQANARHSGEVHPAVGTETPPHPSVQAPQTPGRGREGSQGPVSRWWEVHTSCSRTARAPRSDGPLPRDRRARALCFPDPGLPGVHPKGCMRSSPECPRPRGPYQPARRFLPSLRAEQTLRDGRGRWTTCWGLTSCLRRTTVFEERISSRSEALPSAARRREAGARRAPAAPRPHEHNGPENWWTGAQVSAAHRPRTRAPTGQTESSRQVGSPGLDPDPGQLVSTRLERGLRFVFVPRQDC